MIERQVCKEGDYILDEKHLCDHDLYIIQSGAESLTKENRININYRQVMVLLVILVMKKILHQHCNVYQCQ